MSRHYHAWTFEGGDLAQPTYERRRDAEAALVGGEVIPCEDPTCFVQVRPCRVCGEPVAFASQGQDTALYSCPDGHTKRLRRVY